MIRTISSAAPIKFMEESTMKRSLTLLGCEANKSFDNDVNMTAALIAPLPVPAIPSTAGLVTPL